MEHQNNKELRGNEAFKSQVFRALKRHLMCSIIIIAKQNWHHNINKHNSKVNAVQNNCSTSVPGMVANKSKNFLCQSLITVYLFKKRNLKSSLHQWTIWWKNSLLEKVLKCFRAVLWGMMQDICHELLLTKVKTEAGECT